MRRDRASRCFLSEGLLAPGWATYLRVSDEDKQSPERSFAMQRERIHENLIVPSGIPFYKEYRDILTGTTPNRADYQQLLTDAQAGRFSHLGLYRADRFGRDTAEGVPASRRLINLGIKIRVSDMTSLQPETPDGEFMFSSGQREDYGDKLIVIICTAASPRDGSFHKPIGGRNVPNHHRGCWLAINVDKEGVAATIWCINHTFDDIVSSTGNSEAVGSFASRKRIITLD